jgi:hypothetical protein
VEHERWGTPVASYVAGLTPDARPLDRGKPRDEDTEGGNQPADKSLINRRLSFHSQPCAATTLFSPTANSPNGCSTAPSPLDREHKRLELDAPAHGRINVLGLLEAVRKASVDIRQREARIDVNALDRPIVDEKRERIQRSGAR